MNLQSRYPKAIICVWAGARSGGGRCRPSILSDAVRGGHRGALYLDGGMETARAFILAVCHRRAHGRRRRRGLQDKAAGDRTAEPGGAPALCGDRRIRPDHNKHFVVEVHLNSNCIGKGEGHSKKLAGAAGGEGSPGPDGIDAGPAAPGKCPYTRK